MPFFRLCTAVVLAAWMTLPAAQPTPRDGDRGSLPPGESRDQSRPSEGAIKGGSAATREPGEAPIQAGRELEREIARCNALKGTLREDCLREVNAAAQKNPPAQRRSP